MLIPLVVHACLAQGAQQPAVDFASDVRPLLRAHCWECHGATKQRGDVRLDRREFVFGADRDNWIVVPGDPDGSQLITVLELPSDDEGRMPQQAPPLRTEDIAALRRWVAEGAVWPESADAPAPMPIVLNPAASAARDAALVRLRASKLASIERSTFDDALCVSFRARRKNTTGDAMYLLHGLEPCLTSLDASGTGVTDRSTAAIARMHELRHLDLAECRIGDATIARLVQCSKLRVLNVFGTGLTDACVDDLAKLPQLRKLYVWRTGLTDAAIAELQSKLPDLTIERGERHRALAAIARREDAKRAKLNTVCPVTGKPADPNILVPHAGGAIAVCCAKCRETVAADPERYADAPK